MIVDSMSKQEVMSYIRKEYNTTILPHFRIHLKRYEANICPICLRGKQNRVTLKWEEVLSKDKTKFHLQVFGDKNHIDSVTVAEFVWQEQHCFAYIKHGLMVVFSEHALRRYEERIFEFGPDVRMDIKKIFKIVMKLIPLSYRTILPSPTHPLCYYFVVLNALFLGDFDEKTYRADQKEGEIWLNTCISLKEAGPTQVGILNTLRLLPFHIKELGFSPFDTDVIADSKTYKFSPRNKNWPAIQCISKSVYLIDKLFLMMDLPVSKIIIDLIYAEMRYAEALLKWGGVDVTKLTPYGKDGIAIRGELDYKGKS